MHANGAPLVNPGSSLTPLAPLSFYLKFRNRGLGQFVPAGGIPTPPIGNSLPRAMPHKRRSRIGPCFVFLGFLQM